MQHAGSTTHPFENTTNTSGSDRVADLVRSQDRRVFDLVIIGGGINGAAIAHDAALRGYSVALLEQSDLAFGTSSRSSRLIHGGLRYLEQGAVSLVFEAVSERAMLARVARHIVRPLPFIVPVYREDTMPLSIVDLGLWIYDGLALFRNYRTHQRLRFRQIKDHLPGIREANLKGGVLYYDYQTDDARMVLENALAAQAAGAEILTYSRVESLELQHGRVVAANVKDVLDNTTFQLRGRAFVCAAGPWTDKVLGLTKRRASRWIRPTKGVHLVVPREKLAVDYALVMRHPQDGRVLFVLPYHERTVIGTTDTDFQGDPALADTKAEDVRYLLDAAMSQFPGCELCPRDVISSWSGVRPLVAAEDAASPSDVSREHRIHVRTDGLVVIAGGKLTTYRRMAAECVDRAAPVIDAAGGTLATRRSRTAHVQLPGSIGLHSDADLVALEKQLARRFGDDAQVGDHLARVYGVRARRLALLIDDDPRLAERIDPDLPYVYAEAAFAAEQELVRCLSDFMIRRTHLFYRALDQGVGPSRRIAELIGAQLGWNDEQTRLQHARYLQHVAENRAWRDEPQMAAQKESRDALAALDKPAAGPNQRDDLRGWQ
jgi:glycerol-3-phosphate dehydrogenase